MHSSFFVPRLVVVLVALVVVRLDLAPATLEVRLRYGRSTAENEDVALSQDSLGLDAGVLKLFDLPGAPWVAGFGIRLGVDGVRQRFDGDGESPDRQALVGRLAPVVRLEWALTPSLSLASEGGVDLFLAPEAEELQAVLVGALVLTSYLW